jgi:hypothetical protein
VIVISAAAPRQSTAKKYLSAVKTEHKEHESNTLTAAKAALAAGVVLQLENRIAIVGGSSRSSSTYWARQRELQRAVDDAREQFDDAYSTRDVLK